MASSDTPTVAVAHAGCPTGSPMRDQVAPTVRWVPGVRARGVELFGHGLALGRGKP